MTQTPHDQLAKQYLEEFLAPLGKVERQYEVPGEAKFVDVWFVPQRSDARLVEEIGILGRMTQGMSLFEPFRNAPTRTDVRTCLLKLLWIQDDEQRKAKQADQPLAEADLPMLWILASTVSQPLLKDTNGLIKADWHPGIYFMAELLKTAIVAIDELPETSETLWLRVLGRGATQKRAIEEVLALPRDYPRRRTILRLVASWKVRMDISELVDFAQQEDIMAFSEAFLAWEQEKEVEQSKKIALKMLGKQLELETIAEVTGLPIAQIKQLQSQVATS
jgi:hypothetical protein